MALAAAPCTETRGMPAGVNNHARRVLSSLNQQRAAGRFCDAVLNVEDGMVFSAHRNILACFSELFQQSSLPAAPGTELCLQECPKDGLELLLNFVYTGELKLDPDNLDKVQQAASSLCVPEALTLCQQFKETSEDPVSLKRKRGRPRRSTLETTSLCLVKEEKLLSKDDSVCDTTTVTRSGRVVKGLRRLLTDESTTEKISKRPPVNPTERDSTSAVEEKLNPNLPADKSEVQYMRNL